MKIRKWTKEELNQICKCGHRFGEHSQMGCNAKISETADVNNAFCKCEKFEEVKQ